MPNKRIIKSVIYGAFASGILLGIYFAILSLVSGWNFAKDQFFLFWYFIVSLAVGFGVQVGLYVYLKNLVQGEKDGKKIVGITGTTSTTAMISCCAHYLVNLLPIIGVAGVATFVAQYQREFFWIGLLFNLGGIVFMASKIIKHKQV